MTSTTAIRVRVFGCWSAALQWMKGRCFELYSSYLIWAPPVPARVFARVDALCNVAVVNTCAHETYGRGIAAPQVVTTAATEIPGDG